MSRKPNRKDPVKVLFLCAATFSALSTASYAVANRIPFDPAMAAWNPATFLYIIPLYAILSAPFFFAGWGIAYAYSARTGKISLIYLSDLSGACLGAAATLFIFIPGGCAAAFPLLGILAALSALILAGQVKERNLPAIPVFILLVQLLLAITRPSFLAPNISPFKALNQVLMQKGAEIIKTKWTAYARVDILRSPTLRFAPGISLSFQGRLPKQIGITVDGDGLNSLILEKEQLDFIKWLPSSLPYNIIQKPDVLIISPGGGLEILTADFWNAKRIKAVEPNGLLASILDDYGITRIENFTLKRAGARAELIMNGKEKFDVIRLPITSAMAAASSGLYGLSERFELTEEALASQIKRLTGRGCLSISRYLLPPPRTELKLWITLVKALEHAGVKRPSKHLAAIRSLTTIEMLAFRSPLGPEITEKIRRFCLKRWFDLVYLPDIRPEETNRFSQFEMPIYFEMFKKSLNPFTRRLMENEYAFDIREVTDSRPYPGHIFKVSRISDVIESVGGKWQILLEGGYIVPLLFAQVVPLGLLLITVPALLVRRRSEAPLPVSVPFIFFLLGLGYIITEISFIQRATKYLDTPYHSFTLILITMLLSSGIGGAMTGVYRDFLKRLPVITLLIAAAITAHYLLLDVLAGSVHDKILMAIMVGILTIPAGFLMGIPFPTLIAALRKDRPDIVPWAWGANAAASVIGAVAAAWISLDVGFAAVTASSALCYLVIGMILFFSKNI